MLKARDKNSESTARETKPFPVKTFLYYVIAISVTTVLLSQIASWSRAYLKVKKEMTEETEALLAKREQETHTPKITPGKATQRKEHPTALQSADESSIRSYRSALQLNPDSVDSRQRLGAALLARNRNKEAIEVLSEGVKRLPYSVQLRSMLAEAFEKDGQLNAALQQYESLTRYDPSTTEHMVSAARVLESLGRNREALDWYHRAATNNKSFESNYEEALRRLSNANQ